MVSDLTTTFDIDGLHYSISTPANDENIPFYLADMFAEIIEKTSANPNMVIEQLTNKFNYIKKNKDIWVLD